MLLYKKLGVEIVWEINKVLEEDGKKKVLLNGRLYMRWPLEDEVSQRIAIVQICELGIVTQEEIAKGFGVHVKSVYNYIQSFEADGVYGLTSQKRGPTRSSKLNARVRSKILTMALKEGILEYGTIQKRLEEWNEVISPASIRQVLLENGIIDERISSLDECIKQGDLFDALEEHQLRFNFDYDKKEPEKIGNSLGSGSNRDSIPL